MGACVAFADVVAPAWSDGDVPAGRTATGGWAAPATMGARRTSAGAAAARDARVAAAAGRTGAEAAWAAPGGVAAGWAGLAAAGASAKASRATTLLPAALGCSVAGAEGPLLTGAGFAAAGALSRDVSPIGATRATAADTGRAAVWAAAGGGEYGAALRTPAPPGGILRSLRGTGDSGRAAMRGGGSSTSGECGREGGGEGGGGEGGSEGEGEGTRERGGEAIGDGVTSALFSSASASAVGTGVSSSLASPDKAASTALSSETGTGVSSSEAAAGNTRGRAGDGAGLMLLALTGGAHRACGSCGGVASHDSVSAASSPATRGGLLLPVAAASAATAAAPRVSRAASASRSRTVRPENGAPGAAWGTEAARKAPTSGRASASGNVGSRRRGVGEAEFGDASASTPHAWARTEPRTACVAWAHARSGGPAVSAASASPSGRSRSSGTEAVDCQRPTPSPPPRPAHGRHWRGVARAAGAPKRNAPVSGLRGARGAPPWQAQAQGRRSTAARDEASRASRAPRGGCARRKRRAAPSCRSSKGATGQGGPDAAACRLAAEAMLSRVTMEA